MSKIFTNAESELLNKALKDEKGWRKDPTGLYCNRIKPKLLELLDWSKRKKEIEKLFKVK